MQLKKSRIQIKKLQEKLQMDSGRQREEAIKKCRGASKMMQKNLVALVTGHKSLCRARIEYISAHMEIEHLEASVAAHQAKIKAAQSNLKGLKDRVERASAEYKHVKTKAQAALARANKEAPIEGPPPDKKPLPLKEKLAKLPEDLTSLNEMIRDKEELLERYDVDNQIVAQYEVVSQLPSIL
jgi:chromosome segregation ATPase